MDTGAADKVLESKTSANVVIQRGSQGFFSTLSEMWRYRELFSFLAWRDISVRYKQTVFGILWVLLQPLVSTALFVTIKLLFLMRSKSLVNAEVVAQIAKVLCGMVCWNLFSQSFNNSSNSLLGNVTLVTRVYFPRLVIPISSILSSLLDFAIGLSLVGILIVYSTIESPGSIHPGLSLLALPLFVIMTLMISLGMGIFFAAVNVRFRDVRFVLGYLVQIGMHASATWWTLEDVPEKYRLLVAANPMVGVMEGFRWSLIGDPFPGTPLVISAVFAVLALIFGCYFFMKSERTFADVI